MTTAAITGLTLATLLTAGSSFAEPSDAERNLSRFAKGVYAERSGNVTEARGHFEAALADDPGSFSLAQKTSAAQLADEDLPAASKTLRAFAKSQPGHLPSHLYYADFLGMHARNDAAARHAATELLESANERFPHRSDVYSRLINHYENGGERDKSLAVFNAQFEASGAGPDHWMALAPIARTLLPGDSPELTERLDLIALKTIETGVMIPSAARSASDYYRTTDRLAEAIVVLEKHVEAVPNSLALRTRLGLLLFSAKRDEDALKVLTDTLLIDPDQLLAHKSLARYYEQNGEAERSLPHHAEVLRLAGGAPEEFLELSERYLEFDQPHQARLLLEKARFNHPDSPAIAARLAIAALRDGDTSLAASLFRQAEALAEASDDPSAKKYLDADFQLEFASSLRTAGDTEAAETRLREAIRGIPPEEPKKTARALRQLAGLWLDQNKNQSAAVSLLKRADGLEPGNEETQELLQKARSKK